MGFSADTYLSAASEHVNVAQELYVAQRYVLSFYAAGLSVECVLRAYRQRVDPQFDERHDLDRLARAGRFYDAAPRGQIPEISAAMSDIVTRWENDHRFRSEKSLRKFLTGRKLFRGIRGDIVKENCRKIVNAALRVVTVGDVNWKI